MREAFETALGEPVADAVKLAGGASKEAWAVFLRDGTELIVRRASGGVIHRHTLSLRHEYDVLEAAVAAGVRAPRPVAYLGEIDGREAFAMERVRGETIGRRIVRSPPPGLDVELAEELARIHAIPAAALPFLEGADPVETMTGELDAVDEPHPALELGLHYCRERLGATRAAVVLHGDFRVGNFVVDQRLVAVLDWEFAHLGDAVEDVAWPLVRAWRFGRDELRLGGIAGVDAYLARYAELTGVEVTTEELHAWEVFGNVKWGIGCLSQSRRHLRGEERSVEYAVLGRMAAEMEYELLDLIERGP